MNTTDTLLGNRTSVYNNLKQNIQTPASPIKQPEGLRSSNDGLTLRDHVEKAMHNYLSNLDGQEVTDIYQMVLSEVEAPLLETLMQHTRGNQTRVATWLGINRGTCRKKLKQYGLI